MDARPSMAAALAAFGVPAVVKVDGQRPINTTVIWLSPLPEPFSTGDLMRRELIRTIAVSRQDVPALPRGSAVIAAEQLGDAPVGWRVDRFEHGDATEYRVIVVRDPSLD